MKGVRPEREFQKGLIDDIKQRFPGCLVMKTDPNYIQGIPDLLILHGSRWAMLEVKKSEGSIHQPNQDFYVGKLNDMSYSSFVYPENKEVVLNDMEQALRS